MITVCVWKTFINISDEMDGFNLTWISKPAPVIVPNCVDATGYNCVDFCSGTEVLNTFLGFIQDHVHSKTYKNLQKHLD